MSKPATIAARKAAGSATKPPAKPTPAKRKDAPGRDAAPQPTMHFRHSEMLRARTLAVLDALDAAPGDPGHGVALADLVTELVEAGMDDFFMRALMEAQVGFVAEQSARLGISGAVRIISSISRKFLLRMDHGQLRAVAAHIRSRS